MLFLVGRDRALGAVWWLRPGESAITVGRKGTSFVVEGDHSVSRRHATISTSEIADGQVAPTVMVKDEGSKFGLFLNGRRSDKNEIAELRIDDLVTFGGQASTFQLRYVKFALFPVNMKVANSEDRDEFFESALELGIQIATNVLDCTHVVMPSLVVKSTVVTALVYGLPIVALDWIDQIRALPQTFKVADPTSDAVKTFVASLMCLPTPQIPSVPADSPIDLSAVGWEPDARRRQLFEGKLFVFVCSTQFDRYIDLVEGAGGIAISVKEFERPAGIGDSGSENTDGRLVDAAAKNIIGTSGANAKTKDDCGRQVCIVTPVAAGSDKKETDRLVVLAKALARKLNTCPVSESEIGLAVLFVSCEEHVNPQITEQIGEPAVAEKKLTTAAAPAPAAAQPADGGPRKRRRGINSFWSSLVSSPADSNKGGDQATKQPASAAPVAPAVQSSKTKPAGTADGRPSSSEPLQTGAAAVVGDHAEQCGADHPGLIVQKVRLVNPKQTPGPQQHQQIAGVPNFKRFKKTIHIYQLSQR